jgi:hypothetical protein
VTRANPGGPLDTLLSTPTPAPPQITPHQPRVAIAAVCVCARGSPTVRDVIDQQDSLRPPEVRGGDGAEALLALWASAPPTTHAHTYMRQGTRRGGSRVSFRMEVVCRCKCVELGHELTAVSQI